MIVTKKMMVHWYDTSKRYPEIAVKRGTHCN